MPEKVAPDDGKAEDQGTAFTKDSELANGPVKKRSCTNPEWCLIFLLHVVFFWICAFQGAGAGDPWRLVKPRDFQGQYCGLEKQWRKDGTNMKNFEKAAYTLNLSVTIDPLAEKFICSTQMKSVLTQYAVVTDADYTAGCGTTLFGGSSVSSLMSSFENSVNGFFKNPGSVLLGSTSLLTDTTKNFHKVCTTSCSLTNAWATENFTYRVAPDKKYYPLWNKMVAWCSGTGSGNSACNDNTGSVLDKFKFDAIPKSKCPYDDRQYCVVVPGIKFKELSSGYCTMELNAKVAGAVTSAMSNYLQDLSKTNLVGDISGGASNAVGQIQNTWDVFIIVSILSLVCGFIYLVLLRFLVKPVIWSSILMVFLFLVVGGAACAMYSTMCKDAKITDTAKEMAASLPSNQTVPECGGQYQIQDKTNRDILKGMAVALFIMAALYVLAICCLFTRIRLAITINEVAAIFVFNTPHIIFVPIIQALISILWMAAWMALASFLLSQVPTDRVPLDAYKSYDIAAGTDDKSGKCTDSYPSGFAFHDTFSAECKAGNCWKCAPPRYIFDYRFAFSFFALLWHNAFYVACGQCIIAGAVGIWFFKDRGKSKEETEDKAARTKASRSSVLTSVKNTFVFHAGSMAFGSFILAVVQFLRWLCYYLQKQAEAEKNKVAACIAKVAGYLLWCFEKCIKFLNKNAYIQIALLGTPFCVSAKNAFFLILRNAARFGVMGSLGAVIRFIGKGFVMATTALLGFFILKGMHPDIDTPVALVACYLFIGYFVGALFMNVFGLAVDSTLQCFIATEEMGIEKDFIPEKLQKFVKDTEGADKSGCCGCFNCCCGSH